jgi:Holliday junction resolvase RusA-like endonuclease
MEADKKFEGLEGRFINEVLNNIKTVFESEVRKRYEDYKAMLQRYGSKPIEIDGELKAKLSIRLFSKNYTHEVVLGYL